MASPPGGVGPMNDSFGSTAVSLPFETRQPTIAWTLGRAAADLAW